ncbi:MAG: hypothetical protein UX60_C0011G0012 [Berkelbacteria bacterium GW2011_GWA2_46_7]|uniref:DUF2231 domain-containing protein n=1 Tax=Berkelbacteria bacterium GW2011_GWA2_46_7 TaxID=1618335 RepID=A0A0G1QGT2_9BACT|nr:MAG: hypothetical protein UX60_C0011G0012 [Berkelbacteria bacterium GW2011_GWA2_46_7]
MNLVDIITAKPVLIGIHLGFAILAIDAFLWLLGEMRRTPWQLRHLRLTAFIGVLAYAISWLAGGYYYVKFYGTLVKPIIKASEAPWVHNIVMETKEHIFLFIIPLAVTAALIAWLKEEDWRALNIRRPSLILVGFVSGLGLLIGLMGFIISASARWGGGA